MTSVNTSADAAYENEHPGVALLREHVSSFGGQERPQQLAMVEAVEKIISKGVGGVLAVQAGTGTGKSLAYLYPSVAAALSTHNRGDKKRIVVATATKQLSEQLYEHDVPKVVDVAGGGLTYALLKGRSNYVCLSSLEDLKTLDAQAGQTELFTADSSSNKKYAKKADTMRKLSEWAETTYTGDRTEAPECTDLEWSNFSTGDCPGAKKCPFGEICYTEKARAKARKADIVLTNHALLAHDMRKMLDDETSQSLFGPYDILIIDEAHDFVDTLSDTLSNSVVLDHVEKHVGKLRVQAPNEADMALSTIDDVRTVWEACPKDEVFLEPPGAEVTDFAVTAIKTLVGKVERENKGNLKVSTAKTLSALSDAAKILEMFASPLPQGHVGWVHAWGNSEKNAKKGKELPIAATIAPLTPGDVFRQMTHHATTILTSATLTLGSDFSPFLHSLGFKDSTENGGTPYLEWGLTAKGKGTAVEGTAETEESSLPSSQYLHYDPGKTFGNHVFVLNVGSPFNYPKQGMLYIPTGKTCPIPAGATREDHKKFVLETTLRLVNAAGGRTLALFTTTRSAEEAAEFLRGKVPSSINVYAQGEAPAGALVRSFADDETSVLCATMGLWQGVDVPGSSCSVVVVDKVGFAPPTDVLTAARVENAKGSGFRDIVLAQAGRSLTQAAGRLIRTPDDKGVVAILDPRLHTQWYGPELVASLPPFNVFVEEQKVVDALERLSASLPEPDKFTPSVPTSKKVSRPRKKAIRRRRT